MGFFGTDSAEKSGSTTLDNRPQLTATSIEGQAKYISNFGASADDLTFKERTVRDITERGRVKVVDELMQGLAQALRKFRERQRADQAATAALAAAAGAAPSRAVLEVRSHLNKLRRIREGGKPADIVAARPSLEALGLLSIDALTLKKTKVAAELNQDYWKSLSAPEVRRLATGLLKKWRSAYRREEDGPSERTLRNTASEMEENAHALAPRALDYGQLIEAVLKKLAPELAQSLLEGREQAQELVGRIYKRQTAENKNKGNAPPPPLALQAPAKRPRLKDEERPLALENRPAAGRGPEGQAASPRKPSTQQAAPPGQPRPAPPDPGHRPAAAAGAVAPRGPESSADEPPLPPPAAPPPAAAPRTRAFAARLSSTSHSIVLPI